MGALSGVRVVHRDEAAPIPLPNGSWSRMLITDDRVQGNASSLGLSTFTPGTATASIAHEAEEFAYVVSGRGELRLDGDAVAFAGGDALYIPARVWHATVNLGSDDVVMVFGFAHPTYPPTERGEVGQ